MIGHGLIKAIGEVRGYGDGRGWMLRVSLIAVENVGWTDRSG